MVYIFVIIALLLFIFINETNAMPITISSNHTIHNWNSLFRKYANDSISALEIKAIVMGESSGNPNAINPRDPSYGLGQITLYIGKKFAGVTTKEELYNPETNIKACAGFLTYLKKRYSNQFPNYEWIQMYNTGEPKFFDGLRVPDYQRKFQRYLSELQGTV